MIRAFLKEVGEIASLSLFADDSLRAMKISLNAQTTQGSPICTCSDVAPLVNASLNFLKFQKVCMFTEKFILQTKGMEMKLLFWQHRNGILFNEN